MDEDSGSGGATVPPQPLTVASNSSEPTLQKGAAGASTAAPPATAVPNSSFQASIVPLKVLAYLCNLTSPSTEP